MDLKELCFNKLADVPKSIEKLPNNLQDEIYCRRKCEMLTELKKKLAGLELVLDCVCKGVFWHINTYMCGETRFIMLTPPGYPDITLAITKIIYKILHVRDNNTVHSFDGTYYHKL